MRKEEVVDQRQRADMAVLQAKLRRRRAVLRRSRDVRSGSVQYAGAAVEAADELAEVEAALGRMDAGVYGICAGCGVCLTADYLHGHPTAQLCPRCSARHAPD